MTRLAVVLGSVRPNSVGKSVAKWLVSTANSVENVHAEFVDLAEFALPVFAEELPPSMATPQDPAGVRFNESIRSFDAVIFVSPEYNHSIPGALKNAIDFLQPAALAHKAVGLVGYSFYGGIRPVEHLRNILATFQAGVVTPQMSLSLIHDFANKTEFTPAARHQDEALRMIQAMLTVSEAFASVRN